jgi:hypothetical protein
MSVEFNEDLLNRIPRMPVSEARKIALDLVEGIAEKSMKQKLKKNRLKYDLQTARNSAAICGILYRIKLSFEGIGVVGSEWQQHYNSV